MQRLLLVAPACQRVGQQRNWQTSRQRRRRYKQRPLHQLCEGCSGERMQRLLDCRVDAGADLDAFGAQIA